MNKKKSKFITLLLTIFLGFFGIDRIYLRKYFTGFLKLILAIIVVGLTIYVLASVLPTWKDSIELAKSRAGKDESKFTSELLKIYRNEFSFGMLAILIAVPLVIWWAIDLIFSLLFIRRAKGM